MKLKATTTTTLEISGMPGLDTVTVFLQDFQLGHGRLVVECYGKAWASYWPAMGPSSLAEFVLSCDVDYLVRNLMRYRAHGMKCADQDREELYLERIVSAVRDGIRSHRRTTGFAEGSTS